MTAGVLTSAVLLGLSSGLSSAVGKPAEQVEPSLVVARYVFSGENPVSEEELQQLLQRHRRQLATLKQLEEQAKEVQKYLRERGHFVATDRAGALWPRNRQE